MCSQDNSKDARRTFCKLCIGGMTVASTGAVAYPIVAFLGRPTQVSASKPLEVPLDALAPGQAQYGEFQGQQVIVLMNEDGPLVFGASCPHLGCNVVWDAAEGKFHCPCHGAAFNNRGEVVSGPVSSPLAIVPFEIKDNKIIVS